MSSLPPFWLLRAAGGAAAAAGIIPLGEVGGAAGPGRVLAGAGMTGLATFCVALGGWDPVAGTGRPVPSSVAPRFGSALRPGGGGGFDGGADGEAARIAPDAGGSGGGAEILPPDAGGDEPIEPEGRDDGEDVFPVGCPVVAMGEGFIAGKLPWLGGCAGPGIPINVFFVSSAGGMKGTAGAAAMCELDPGGGGGAAAAGVAGVLFFPSPSKMSRSEPLLLSSDIRVS